MNDCDTASGGTEATSSQRQVAPDEHTLVPTKVAPSHELMEPPLHTSAVCQPISCCSDPSSPAVLHSPLSWTWTPLIRSTTLARGV